MTIEEQYQQLLEENAELANHFLQLPMAPQWIHAIRTSIAPWITKEHDKGLWQVVHFVSGEKRFIKKKLSRRLFTEMVMAFCGDALEKHETAKKIEASMEKYKFATKLEHFDRLPDAHLVRKHVKIVEDFFAGACPTDTDSKSEATVASRLEDYLRHTYNPSPHGENFWVLVKHPDYAGATPTMALEKYANERFFRQKICSFIIVFECISRQLDKDLLNQFLGLYSGEDAIKLFIVGEHGLTNDVYERAKKRRVGYIQINPKHEMTADSYVLPRFVDYSDNSWRRYLEMLMGQRPADVPLLVFDGQLVDCSLADMLQREGVAIQQSHQLKAPKMKNETIEAKADRLTSAHVEECKHAIYMFDANYHEGTKDYSEEAARVLSFLIHHDDPSAIEFSVDPYPMICNNGLQCEERELPANQLGFINLQEKKIVLNSLGKSNAGRYRFTMAHEFGHYILHEYLLKAQGVVSFGDTTDSIMKAPTIKNEDMQWLERQANRFASALLMPEELIRKLYELLHRTFLGVRYGDTLQPLHYSDGQKETYDPYNQIVKTMAKTLNVSPDAMGIRLKQLGLLDQTRNDSFNQGGPFNFNNIGHQPFSDKRSPDFNVPMPDFSDCPF